MDSAKAQEFLERYGSSILDMMSSNVRDLREVCDDAIEHGWNNILRTCQQEIDATIEAMRELEQLRGEG